MKMWTFEWGLAVLLEQGQEMPKHRWNPTRPCWTNLRRLLVEERLLETAVEKPAWLGLEVERVGKD